jgi:hypothetical protein
MEAGGFAAGDLWGGYRAALARLYEEDDLLLLDEDALGVFYERAQGLSEAFREQLATERDDPSRLEGAVLAVAALEVAVASDVFLVEFSQRREFSARLEPDLELGPEPAREEVTLLLREADSAFGEGYGMAGAAADPSPTMIRVDRGIATLVHSCAEPAGAFVRGIVLTEVDTLLGCLQIFEDIGELSFGSHRLRFGSGLIVTAIEKLSALVQESMPGDLVHYLGGVGLNKALDYPIRGLGEPIIHEVVRAGRARRQAALRLRGQQLDAARGEALDASLSSLCLDYERKMRTAARIAKRMRQAGPLVVLLGGVGPGRLIVAGLNGAGLAYTLYSCSDRLDTVPGPVPGIRRLVEKALA